MFIVSTALTWSSPVIPKLKEASQSPLDPLPSTEDTTWISSIILFGASVGSLIFSFLADQLGRKITILCLGIPVLISYLSLAFLPIVEIYYIARFITGLAVGGAFSVVPVYIAELASKSNRAALCTLASCGVNGGCLFSYIVGPFVEVTTFNIILSILPVFFLLLFVIFGEETAHFYVLKGRKVEATATLVKLRPTSEDIEAEIKDMNIKLHLQSQGSLFEVLTKKSVLKAFLIAIGLLIFQQFSGINILLFYSQTIFEMSGSSIDSKICPIITGSVQFASSLVSIYTSSKFGRKPLLIVSCLGMIVGFIPLGTYCYLRDLNYNLTSISFIPILSLAVVALLYNIGIGPLPWAILGEVFPSRVKAIGTSIATFINWTLAFILTKYFEYMTEGLGLGESFFLYAACMGVCTIFIIFVMVETRGKTLEEIQDDLSS